VLQRFAVITGLLFPPFHRQSGPVVTKAFVKELARPSLIFTIGTKAYIMIEKSKVSDIILKQGYNQWKIKFDFKEFIYGSYLS